MTAYKINRADQTFVAKDLAELKLWAASGKLFMDDLVQAPGVTQWAYAAELRELNGLVRQRSAMSQALDTATEGSGRGGASTMRWLVAAMSMLGIVTVLGVAFQFLRNPPDPEDLKISGTGKNALRDQEGLITASVPLRAEPAPQAASRATLDKDTKVSVVSKHGDWYEVDDGQGQRGWVQVDQVAPAYLFTPEAHSKWDPIFNPERYLTLTQQDWQVAENQRGIEKKTLFTLGIANATDYTMDRVVVRIDFLDKAGAQVATRDVEVADLVPPRGSVTVENVEVVLDIAEVPNARIRIVGARVADRNPQAGSAAPTPDGAEGTEVQGTGITVGGAG